MLSIRQCRTLLTSRWRPIVPISPLKRSYYHELSFLQHGEPTHVLEYHQQEIPPVANENDGFVKVEMVAAPWNPADKNVVQGKYPSPVKNPPPQQPSGRGNNWKVAGSEGWGRVIDIRPGNSGLDVTPGSFVTLGHSGMGTFRSSLWLPSSALIPVDRGEELQTRVGHEAAASLFQLGGTAWRMIKDFESLNETTGVIVQNAGNSGVGWMISQLAATLKIRVISLVRRGSKSPDEFERMVDALSQQSTNTTRVVAEEDLLEDKEALKALEGELGTCAPRLAVNAVGGPSASLLLKLLAPGGTLVTYGGLSMQPVTVGTPLLIFKDVKIRGYWHSRWMTRTFPKQRKQMVDELVNAVLDGGVQLPPCQVFPLSAVQEALKFEKEQSHVAVRRKIVFNCQQHED
jgi:mitochondrial enoyl-[acyl-carrier protein] reductase / trans-2-enoyl-CoA reductase